jgi:transcriptional regulator with XRE-family HTH domain
MGERIKYLRTEILRMNQEDFGSSLGVTKSAVCAWEANRRNPTEQVFKAICKTHSVNYDWLTVGEGEPLSDLPQTILDELCQQYELDDLDRSLFQEYLKLTADDRKVLKDYIRNVLNHGK